MKKKNMIRALVCLSSLIGTFSFAFGQHPEHSVKNFPQLFRVTTAETRPGDAVLIRGEYLNKLRGIKVCRLNDDPVDQELPGYVPLPREDAPIDVYGPERKVEAWMSGAAISVDLLQQNSQSVKFIVPETLAEGVFSVQLIGKENMPVAGFYLNVPKVIWVISEEGLKATTGEYLRIQEKNLSRKGVSGQVVLISVDGKTVARTKIDQTFDDYSVSVTIPGNIPVGTYNLYYHIVNCDLREGNYSHWFGIDDRAHSGAQNINIIGTGVSGMNIGALLRRNTLSEFSYIRTSPGASPDAVTDLIIEDNSFNIAKEAIRLGGSANHTSNVLIHNNHYHDVEKQVTLNDGLDPSGCLILNDDTNKKTNNL